MLPQEIIRRKRDGGALSNADIAMFVRGLVDGSWSDAQAAAFAMAALLRGMSDAEAVALTLAMRDSGEVLRWSLPGPAIDKHSTGGIGDNVSLILAPLLAACGAYVPMISGRGLGHTGGTLDKLDAIPGYTSQPPIEVFRHVVATVGCAIIGQTVDLAPADRRLYAIRDVTATVESIPLITASILSKKLAAGLDALVLDVKTGNGAFMASLESARTLASTLVAVANGSGLKTSALLTDMSQPLAPAAGNAVEVTNAVRFLTGEARPARLAEVTIALAVEALALAGLAEDVLLARALVDAALDSGKAAERFGRMVAALGGPPDFIEQVSKHLPLAPVIRAVPPVEPGAVIAINASAIGIAVVELGGGRRRSADAIDAAVGFSELAAVGTPVGPGVPLGIVHARTEADAERAARILAAAYTVGDASQPPAPLFYGRLPASG